MTNQQKYDEACKLVQRARDLVKDLPEPTGATCGNCGRYKTMESGDLEPLSDI